MSNGAFQRDLPLQPARQPWPPGQRRLTIMLVLALCVLAAGWLAPSRQPALRLVYGGPEQPFAYAREARRLIDGASTRLWMTMYVVRVDDVVIRPLLEALAAAHARGVDVRVGLDLGRPRDGEEDLKHVDAAAFLAARGVRVILDEPEVTSHAKVLVADSRRILAGSHNWTRSALTANRELSWLIDDPALAAEIEGWLAHVPGW